MLRFSFKGNCIPPNYKRNTYVKTGYIVYTSKFLQLI